MRKWPALVYLAMFVTGASAALLMAFMGS